MKLVTHTNYKHQAAVPMSHTTKQKELVPRREPTESVEHLEKHRPARTALRNKIHHINSENYEDLDELDSLEKM